MKGNNCRPLPIHGLAGIRSSQQSVIKGHGLGHQLPSVVATSETKTYFCKERHSVALVMFHKTSQEKNPKCTNDGKDASAIKSIGKNLQKPVRLLRSVWPSFWPLVALAAFWKTKNGKGYNEATKKVERLHSM